MRGRFNTLLPRLLLVLSAVALVAVVSAVAGDPLGLRVLPKHKGARLTDAPRLSFVTGTLRQGRHGTWQLADGTRLSVQAKTDWLEEDTGRAGYPSAGRLVMITGQKIGNTITVRQATLLSRQRQIQALQTRMETEPDKPERQLPE